MLNAPYNLANPSKLTTMRPLIQQTVARAHHIYSSRLSPLSSLKPFVLLCLLLCCCTAALISLDLARRATCSKGCRPCMQHGVNEGVSEAGFNSQHPLFYQIQQDLAPYEESGISLEMVEQAYCQNTRIGFRIQVINSTVYVVGEVPGYETRHRSIKRALLSLSLPPSSLPEGLDLVIEHHDWPTVKPVVAEECPVRGPVLVPAKMKGWKEHEHAVLAPDFTFVDWEEANTLPWLEMLQVFKLTGEKVPWEARTLDLFFRGGSTGLRPVFLNESVLNTTLDEDLLNIKLIDWKNESSSFTSLTQHCTHKYLLHLPGNSYAARLKYLLACGSCVLMPATPWMEFWHPLLVNGLHYIEVGQWREGGVDVRQLGELVRDLNVSESEGDGVAERIGIAGRTLVQEVLHPGMVDEYWRLLLQKYRNLQTYPPTEPHPDAIPLEESLLNPHLIGVTQRSCRVCKVQEESEEEAKAALRAELGPEAAAIVFQLLKDQEEAQAKEQQEQHGLEEEQRIAAEMKMEIAADEDVPNNNGLEQHSFNNSSGTALADVAINDVQGDILGEDTTITVDDVEQGSSESEDLLTTRRGTQKMLLP